MKNLLSTVGAQFERLSAREQLLALLMVIAILGMILGMSGWFIHRDLARREVRIEAKMAQLRELANLRQDYQRRLLEQTALADQIRRNNDTRLLSYVETISKAANTEIKNAAERAGTPTGSEILREVAAEVTLENVSIDRLFDFLKRVEEGNALIKVRRLDAKSRFDNPKMLDAKVTIGTFMTSES